MATNIGHADKLAYLLSSVNAASVFLTLAVFFTSLIVDGFRNRDKSKDKPTDKSKNKAKPWTKLHLLQLGITALIVALSIIHNALLFKTLFIAGQTDTVLVSTLFVTLTWVILVLGLVDRDGDASDAYFRAWGVALVLEITATTMTCIWTTGGAGPIEAADVVIQVVRVVAIAVLLAISLVFNGRVPFISIDGTEEERQPLLDAEANETAENVVDKAQTKKKSEDEDAEEEESEEETVDKERLEELKNRPLAKYIASYGIFMPFLRPKTRAQWSYVSVLTTCTLLERLMNVVYPLSLGALVNSLSDAQSIPWLQFAAYAGLSVLYRAGVLTMFESISSRKFTSAIKNELDQFCYNHIMTLSSDFHEGGNSGRVCRLIDRGDVVADLFEKVFFRMIPQITDLFTALAVLAYLFGGYVSFVVASTIVVFGWTSTVFLKSKTKLRRKWVDGMIAQWQHLWETHYNWTTVSHFNRVPHEQTEYEKKTTEMYKRGIVAQSFDAVAQCVRQFVVVVGFVAACIFAIEQIVYGKQGVGGFVMLVTYWAQVMSPVSGLISLVNSTAEQLVDAERLLVILEQKPTIHDSEDAIDIDFKGGAVDFENVTFSYDGERVVSEDISFHIKAGQTVAIVGETGGGKSTLLKLLFRFYDPTKGRILIDGQDVRDLKLESFRDLIGFVPQDPAMFERSIADNVRYPDLTATDEEVEEACKGAVLHDKIMTFTNGYKQKVGKKGARLSGGEQQRLAIARCILKKPKMLLLDEATSSVDSVTESKIHEGLKKLCKGRTTLIIAHRLSTILHADQILVMKNGKLVEAGPHRVLIKLDGPYKELWTAQLKLQAENPDDGDETTDTDEKLAVLLKDVDTSEKDHVSEELKVEQGQSSSSSSSSTSVRHEELLSSPRSRQSYQNNEDNNDDNADTSDPTEGNENKTKNSNDVEQKPQ